MKDRDARWDWKPEPDEYLDEIQKEIVERATACHGFVNNELARRFLWESVEEYAKVCDLVVKEDRELLHDFTRWMMERGKTD